jgi:hypothetical protein
MAFRGSEWYRHRQFEIERKSAMFLVGTLDVLENLLNGGDMQEKVGGRKQSNAFLASICAEELTGVPKRALQELKIFIGRSGVGEFCFGGHPIQHGLHDKKSNHTTRILLEQIIRSIGLP